MSWKVGNKTFLTAVALVAVLAFMVSGCSVLRSKKSDSSSTSTTAARQGKSPFYGDFADVLIPGEMKVDEKSTFVYRTPTFTSGVISVKGRVETNSLITFFENNMEKDNWKLISTFKSPRTMMLFQKENRWCVIHIYDKEFSTYTEIWVAPTVGEMESGLFK